MKNFDNVPIKQLKVIDAFKISLQSDLSTWKEKGFLTKDDYENYKARNMRSVNDSNFSSFQT